MNERIEELMYQAGLTAQGCWDEMDEYERKAIERFADLIVKECVEVANRSVWNGKSIIGQRINDHFGL